MSETPEFVAWTLAYACALRDETDVSNPEQTERQLRVLRSYADAVHAGRCHEGICVDDEFQFGFRAEEVLAAYGGEALVASQCEACSANVLRTRARGRYAGCFGWLVLTAELQSGLALQGRTWPQLWCETPDDRAGYTAQAELWRAVAEGTPALAEPLRAYRAALQIAIERDVPLRWQAYPRGRTDGRLWQLVEHCPRCKREWALRPKCAGCGYVGASEPARTRKARGRRPYVPLARFLGDAGAAAFVARHREG